MNQLIFLIFFREREVFLKIQLVYKKVQTLPAHIPHKLSTAVLLAVFLKLTQFWELSLNLFSLPVWTASTQLKSAIENTKIGRFFSQAIKINLLESILKIEHFTTGDVCILFSFSGEIEASMRGKKVNKSRRMIQSESFIEINFK